MARPINPKTKLPYRNGEFYPATGRGYESMEPEAPLPAPPPPAPGPYAPIPQRARQPHVSPGAAKGEISVSIPGVPGAPPKRYRVYRSSGNGVYALVFTLMQWPGIEVRTTDAALTSGHRYFYALNEINSEDVEGPRGPEGSSVAP